MFMSPDEDEVEGFVRSICAHSNEMQTNEQGNNPKRSERLFMYVS